MYFVRFIINIPKGVAEKLPVALCQMKVTADKDLNLQTARNFVESGSIPCPAGGPADFHAPYEARFLNSIQPVPDPAVLPCRAWPGILRWLLSEVHYLRMKPPFIQYRWY